MLEPEILYEDEALVAVNKPAGLQVHPAHVRSRTRAQEETLVAWLSSRYPDIRTVGDDPATRPGIVHRLDKDTSGVMVIAKTQTAFNYLKSLFQNHEIAKTYLAIVHGSFRESHGTIDRPIGIVDGTVRRSVHTKTMAKPAVTTYEVISHHAVLPHDEVSAVRVMPKTGRTHQIRVHLASIGHPICGDRLYGKQANKERIFPRLMLHAWSLSFRAIAGTGIGTRLFLEAAPPPEFLPYMPAGVGPNSQIP